MLNHVPTRKHAPAPILVRIKLELVNFEMIRQVIFQTIKQYDAFLKGPDNRVWSDTILMLLVNNR